MSQLILIRGLPGSGKSQLASTLWYDSFLQKETAEWCETDDYFTKEGRYKFNPQQLGDAHDWCQKRAAKAMQESTTTVIVSNTFTQLWELQPYLDMAKAYDYTIQVLHCEGNFGSVHGVPEETIRKMKARWEPYVS